MLVNYNDSFTETCSTSILIKPFDSKAPWMIQKDTVKSVKQATWEVETATLKFSAAGGGSGGAVSADGPGTELGPGSNPDPGLGTGRASTSDTESSVMGMNSEGVMAVVRSSDIIGDCSELSPPAPSSSPGHDPGVSPPAPGVMVVELGGSRFTSGGRWWSEVREKRWWAEKDLGSSCFFWRDDRLLLLPPL